VPLTAIAASARAPHGRLIWVAALAAVPLALLPLKAKALELPAVAGPFPTNHPLHLAKLDRPSSASVHDGVGLYAMARSQAIDLTSPGRVMSGPKSPYAQAAGLAWRRANMTAMFGYMRPSSYRSNAFPDDRTPSFRTSSRVGLGFALHY
jgi:hypothetical protein